MSEKLSPEQVEILRSAAAARVDAVSLRGAAREIGMSPSGLQKFLDGAAPYEPTLRRLRAWYGDDDAQREREEAIARVLGLLPAQRRTAAEAILRALLVGSLRDFQALEEALPAGVTKHRRVRRSRGLANPPERLDELEQKRGAGF